jgi:hypothetical protein
MDCTFLEYLLMLDGLEFETVGVGGNKIYFS